MFWGFLAKNECVTIKEQAFQLHLKFHVEVNFLMPEAFSGQLWTLPTRAFFGPGSMCTELIPCLLHWQGFLLTIEVVPSLASVTQKQDAASHITGGHLLLSVTSITQCVCTLLHTSQPKQLLQTDNAELSLAVQGLNTQRG